jgi:hypothetical protein
VRDGTAQLNRLTVARNLSEKRAIFSQVFLLKPDVGISAPASRVKFAGQIRGPSSLATPVFGIEGGHQEP